MRSRSSRALFSTALSAIAVALTLAPPAHAALGTVLRDNDPGGPQVNGRGIAFDGQNLYYSGALNSNIYKMTPQGGPGSALGVIPVPSGDPRIAFGGPLAWDGLALWTIDESAALILYKVDPVSGSTLFSCNIATANPGHPALAGLVNPDGLDWDGSRLVL